MGLTSGGWFICYRGARACGIDSVAVTAAGSGYRNPSVTIVESDPGGSGTGALATAQTNTAGEITGIEAILDVLLVKDGEKPAIGASSSPDTRS